MVESNKRNNGLFTGLPAVFCGVRCPAFHSFFLRSSFLQEQLSHNLLACWLKQKTQIPKKLKYRKFQKKIKFLPKCKKKKTKIEKTKKKTKEKNKRKKLPLYRNFKTFQTHFLKLFLTIHISAFFVFSKQYQIIKMKINYDCKMLIRCK